MVKQVSSAVPGIGATSGIQDQFVRQALRPLVDAHNARNGSSQEGFVTRGELAREVSAVLSRAGIAPAVSSAEDPNGKPLPIKVNGYSKAQLKRDLATGVASILSAAGPDYQLWVDSVGAKIEIGHRGVVYAGYSALADTTNTRLPALAVTAGGIAMGYNDLDGNWVDSVSIEAATGIASFSGTVNALYGNFAEGITIGGTGITLGDLSAGSYNTAALEMDLESGVGGILAGVGGNYRMWVDTVGSQIQIGHKDIAYNAYSAVADTTNTRLPGLAITSAGVAMGFNDIDGTWHDSVSIDAATGTASFLGAVNATSGNFANGITIGGSSVTLGDLAAGSYTTADLLSDLQSGVGSILAGVGGNYRMWIDTSGAQIQFGHKDLNRAGLGSAYSGDLRSGLAVTASGIAMGYNKFSDGAWVNAVSIDATGNVAIAGTLKAGSVVEAGATVGVGGAQIGDISADAAAAIAAVDEISSDNSLTPVEKRQLRLEWDAIMSEKGDLRTQASTFGLSVTSYNSALASYSRYLNSPTDSVTWLESSPPLLISDTTDPGTSSTYLDTTTAISGATLRARSKAYYTQKSLLVNAITAKAKTLADAAKTAADNAQTAADDAQAAADASVQPSAIVNMMVKSSANILTGSIATSVGGGIKAGTIAWDSAGNLTTGSGVAITAKGLVGAQSGSPKFTIDISGNATFMGDINTAGDAYFEGTTPTTTYAIYVDGATYNLDYSVFGYARTNPLSGYARVGLLGVSNATTSSANVGVLGYGTGASGIGVVGQGVKGGGFFYSPFGYALACKSTGGNALQVDGTMTMTSNVRVANLNAQYLGDGSNKLEISGALSTGSATPTFANNKPGSSSTNTWLKILFNGTTYYIPAWT